MPEQNGSWLMIAMYFGFFILIFYLLIIRPRKNQEKKHGEMIENLRYRDKVVTIGGIKAEVAKIKDETVVLKISENSEVEFLKTGIAYKVEE